MALTGSYEGSFLVITNASQRDYKFGYLLNGIKIASLIKRRRNNSTYELWELDLTTTHMSGQFTRKCKVFYNGHHWNLQTRDLYNIFAHDIYSLMKDRIWYLTKYSIDKVYNAMRSLGVLPIELWVEIASTTILTFEFLA